MNQKLLAITCAVWLVACAGSEATLSAGPPDSKQPQSVAKTNHAAIVRAIASPERSAEDRAEDAWRQPATVLDFLRVRPGMHVIDVFAGGGYYSELLARVVGPTGKVIAYNNPPYAKYGGTKPQERFSNGRLPHVQIVTAEVPDLSLPADTLDAALFVLAYHDVYWRPAEGGWEHTDPVLLLRKLHTALKPGGVVVVLDHRAAAGSEPRVTADKLHRIDPQRVRDDFAAAGFAFDGQSNAFAHADDDLTRLVFDTAIRHRTDQFLFRFKKTR
jgi:predicted methyltransferase